MLRRSRTAPRRLSTRRSGVLAATAAGALALGTGASAASPVSGSIVGPVTAVKGARFTLKTPLSPTGSSTVSVGSKTVITEEVAVRRTALKKGVCVMATGRKNARGVVAATRIRVSKAVKGQCTTGFGRRGPRPGGGAPTGSTPQRPQGSTGGFTRPADFGFAFGTITALRGSTLTVKGPRGSTAVTVSATTQIGTTLAVERAAIKTKLCAFVRGTSSDKGVSVQAQDISLSKPTANGCLTGRRGP